MDETTKGQVDPTLQAAMEPKARVNDEVPPLVSDELREELIKMLPGELDEATCRSLIENGYATAMTKANLALVFMREFVDHAAIREKIK